MPPAEFEPAIPTNKRQHTHAEDSAANGIGSGHLLLCRNALLLPAEACLSICGTVTSKIRTIAVCHFAVKTVDFQPVLFR
jgi:hypothetical protein